MKKFFRTLMSLVLVIAVLVSSFAIVPVGAKTQEDYPHVYVKGFMDETIYVDRNNPDSEVIYPMNTDAILGMVKDCIPALLKFAATRNWDTLIDDLIPICNDLLGNWMNNPDGSAKGNSGAYFVYPTVEEIRYSDTLDFLYDWRGDPVEIASELNDFINYVCETTGSDKVAISCHSLGGAITLSYISIYGNDKVDAVAFDSTAIYGESYTGELLCGDVDITGDSLVSYLKFAFEGNDYDYLLNGILDILNEAGLSDIVGLIGDTLVEKLLPRAYPEIVGPLFAGWPTIWAMAPDEYIDEAMDYVFGTLYKDSETDYSGLRERIERYNTLVRENKTETLLQLDEIAKVGVISRYGYSSIPATPSWQNISDGVVDSKNNSFGATIAPYGETLSEEYLQGKDMAYISPDRILDASTCLFPEKTWFVKSLKHSDENADIDKLIDLILYSDEEINVDTHEEFPRFLIHDYETDELIPEEVTEKKETFLDKITNFFLTLIRFIRKVIG